MKIERYMGSTRREPKCSATDTGSQEPRGEAGAGVVMSDLWRGKYLLRAMWSVRHSSHRDQLKIRQWSQLSRVGEALTPLPRMKPSVMQLIYALSKKDQEEMCCSSAVHTACQGGLRYFNIYGTRQAAFHPIRRGRNLCLFDSSWQPPLIFEDERSCATSHVEM